MLELAQFRGILMDVKIINQVISKLASFSSRIERQMLLIQELQRKNVSLELRIEALEKTFKDNGSSKS